MKKLVLLVLLLISLVCFPQQKISQKMVDSKGIVNHMVFDNTKSFIPIERSKQLLQDTLKLLKEDGFILFKEAKDELGFTRQIYQQQYKGIKIEDGLFGVHGRNGKVEYISGEYKKVKNIITTPEISEKVALEKALGYINASKYRWQVPFEESDIKRYKKDSTATFYPKGELLIHKDVFKADSIYRLAYKFDIFAITPLSHKIYYVDAITGDLLDARDLIFDANTPATGTTLYRGTVPIITDSYPGGYRLYETRSANNVEIETYNANNQTWAYDNNGIPIPAGFSEFTNPTTTWTSNAAIDAHWGAEKIYDYWLSSPRSWNSLNGQGMAIHGYVHYGQNLDNAFWDGNEMLYGDGGTVFKTVVSLDVIAHETGHGIMQYTAGFNSNKENPSLNEGFSDIWGAVIEHSVAPDNTNNWLIGEKIMKNGSYLRSLSDPKSKQQPDTYKGTYWQDVSNCTIPNSQTNDQCSCHTNLSVLTYWFYLLSQGGSGTNDLNNAYTVYGISIDNAAKIVWKAEKDLLRLHPGSQYSDVVTQTLQAATDIYGTNSPELIQVQNAWYAVGLNTLPSQLSISGPSRICTQGTYTINNLAAGATVVWSAPSNIVSLQPNGNSVTLTKVGNSIMILTALINNSITLTKTVNVGSPQSVGIVSMSNLTYGGGNWFKVLPGTGFYNYEGSLTVGDDGLGTSYSWSLASKTPGKAAFWSTNGPYVDVAMKTTNTDLQLMCTSSNSCGSHSTYYTFSTGDMVPELVSLIPNPTSSQVEVNIGDAVATNALLSSTAENSNSTSYQIQVVDSYGLTVYSTTKKEKKFTLQTSSFRNGVYAVIVSDGINTYQNKLIVNH